MIVGVAIGTPASRRDAARVVGPPSMPPQDGRAHRPRRARDGRVDAVGPATQRPTAGGLGTSAMGWSAARPSAGGEPTLRPAGVWMFGCGRLVRRASRHPRAGDRGDSGPRSTAGRGAALGPSSRPRRDACSAPSDACAVEPHGRCRAWARFGGMAGSSVLRCRPRCPRSHGGRRCPGDRVGEPAFGLSGR